MHDLGYVAAGYLLTAAAFTGYLAHLALRARRITQLTRVLSTHERRSRR